MVVWDISYENLCKRLHGFGSIRDFRILPEVNKNGSGHYGKEKDFFCINKNPNIVFLIHIVYSRN